MVPGFDQSLSLFMGYFIILWLHRKETANQRFWTKINPKRIGTVIMMMAERMYPHS